MIVPGPDGPALIVCTTCRGPGRVDGGGAALAAALAALPGTGVAIAPMACLWSCERGASVQLRAPGKIGYVMGGFAPADAPDLLAFAQAYAASADGEVPYREWPKGVLGRFLARTPPAGGLVA